MPERQSQAQNHFVVQKSAPIRRSFWIKRQNKRKHFIRITPEWITLISYFGTLNLLGPKDISILVKKKLQQSTNFLTRYSGHFYLKLNLLKIGLSDTGKYVLCEKSYFPSSSTGEESGGVEAVPDIGSCQISRTAWRECKNSSIRRRDRYKGLSAMKLFFINLSVSIRRKLNDHSTKRWPNIISSNIDSVPCSVITNKKNY